MNLVRLGHYFVPNGEGDGSCQTALVVGVNHGKPPTVNLQVWPHEGEEFKRIDVEYVLPGEASSVALLTDSELPTDHATFHLSGSCPWGR